MVNLLWNSVLENPKVKHFPSKGLSLRIPKWVQLKSLDEMIDHN